MSDVAGSTPDAPDGRPEGRDRGGDVLSRLAARSVGQGASARPRPRSRFEPAPGGTIAGEAPVEGLDPDTDLDGAPEDRAGPTALTAPLHAGRRARLGTTASGRRPGTGTGADGSAPGTDADLRTTRDHDDRTSAAVPGRGAGGRRGPAPGPTGSGGSATRAGGPIGIDGAAPDLDGSGAGRTGAATGHAAPPDDGSGRHLGVVAARPATRARPGQVPLAGSAGRAGATGGSRTAGPLVQIHIGRLDVRANLEASAPEPRPAPVDAPAGLSLADYLAGKREVR